MLRSYLPRLPMLSGGSSVAAGMGAAAAAAVGAGSGGGPEAGGEQQPCGICSAAEILTPYAAEPCGHRFCYYCLRSHCLADAQYSCPLCLRHVDAMRQVAAVAAADSSSGGGGGTAADSAGMPGG